MNYYSENKMSETDVKKIYDNKMQGNQGMMNDCGMMGGFDCGMMSRPEMGCAAMPVYECPQERVCHRYVCYEVPHIMPCNTRIINHHVFRHTYRPEFTCCEENVCENVFDQRCC